MKTIYFKLNGRFTNNLFQYFASEIIKKIYNYDDIKIYTQEFLNSEYIFTKIDDILFKKIGNDYIRGNIINIDTSKDILMDGYFQRSEIFTFFREHLISLFNSNNYSFINSKVRICDIVNHNISHNILPENEDLIVHLRLDDFIGDLQIFSPLEIIKIIKNISYNDLYIVCDKIKYDWELKYLGYFNELNPIFINYDMLDDFKFIMNSKKVLISASTFSWMATFLNKNINEVHIPYNTFHGGEEGNGQNLSSFSDKCIVYKGLSYWNKK